MVRCGTARTAVDLVPQAKAALWVNRWDMSAGLGHCGWHEG
jgi:hypothetical protein